MAPVEVHIEVQAGPFEASLGERLFELAATIFGPGSLQAGDFQWRLDHMPTLSGTLARVEDQLVGFKLGYAVKRAHYYSWLGGVHPDWLRQGIAMQLMREQHRWLKQQRFAAVETGAQADNDAMRALNLAAGFEEIGRRTKTRGPEVLYLKRL